MFTWFSQRHIAVATCVVGLTACVVTPASAGAAQPVSEVAITFDDLPVHGPMPAGVTPDMVAKSIVDTLKAAKAPPVYGMLNANAMKWTPSAEAALKIWRDGGNLLGNHTFSHPGLSKLTLEAYEADIEANEPVLKTYMGTADWHYLRLPFLDGGDTPEKRAGLVAYMEKTGYRLADISIGFNDYEYNPAYARCLAKNDQASIDWMKAKYLKAASDAIDFSRKGAQNTFGRDIKHVYLLHIGAFDALMFPEFLKLLKAKGFRLVTLPEAESDPVYKDYATAATGVSGLLLNRAMAAKNSWVPAPPNDTSATLATLCP